MRFALFALAFSGCTMGQKLILDRNPKVFSRLTGEECKRVWFRVGYDYFEEGFGPPCHITIYRDNVRPYDGFSNERPKKPH
jgi:hypothetical protein